MTSAEHHEEIRRGREEWEDGVLAATLAKRPEREDVTTFSGIPVQRLYGPEDRTDGDFLTRIGFPGEFPFT